MRGLFTILFILFTLSLRGQMIDMPHPILMGDQQPFFSQPVRIILTYAGVTALNAIGDGLNDRGQKPWGHLCNAASMATLAMSFNWIDYDNKKWYWYAASLVSFRIALFDPTYNIVRGNKWSYVGNTSTWDKFLQKVNPPEGFVIERGCFLIFAVFIPINQIK